MSSENKEFMTTFQERLHDVEERSDSEMRKIQTRADWLVNAAGVAEATKVDAYAFATGLFQYICDNQKRLESNDSSYHGDIRNLLDTEARSPIDLAAFQMLGRLAHTRTTAHVNDIAFDVFELHNHVEVTRLNQEGKVAYSAATFVSGEQSS